MINKVLIKLYVPELDYTFDIFIPVNEVIWKIKKLILKSIYDLTGGAIDMDKEYVLLNKNTSKYYDNNSVVINTDIRNATELIILSIKSNNQNIINAQTGIPEGFINSHN